MKPMERGPHAKLHNQGFSPWGWLHIEVGLNSVPKEEGYPCSFVIMGRMRACLKDKWALGAHFRYRSRVLKFLSLL